MSDGDNENEEQADDRCDRAVGAGAVCGGSGLEGVGSGSAGDHAEDGDRAVSVALACQNKLTQRAAAEQGAAPADDGHAEQVPQPFGMCDGLAFKAPVQRTADGVANQNGDDDAAERGQQTEFLEHDGVTNAADHAEAALLRQRADDQTDAEREQDGSVHGAGAFLGECEEAAGDQGENEAADEQDREEQAFHGALFIGSAEAEVVLQEEDADQDAEDEAHQADDRVQVAAADTDDHTQWAAKEDQRADHDRCAERKADEGGAAGLRLEFLADECHDAGAGDDTDDLWAEVLDGRCAVELQGAGDVTQEAGDAEAHVGRVAELHQKDGDHADQQPCAAEDQGFSFFLHKRFFPSNNWSFSTDSPAGNRVIISHIIHIFCVNASITFCEYAASVFLDRQSRPYV